MKFLYGIAEFILILNDLKTILKNDHSNCSCFHVIAVVLLFKVLLTFSNHSLSNPVNYKVKLFTVLKYNNYF